jgi:hypothetical protein
MWRGYRTILGSVACLVTLAACEPAAAPLPPKPWDGFYSGQVIATSDGHAGVACPDRFPKRDMAVVDGYVNFGAYQGAINADGAVILSDGQTSVNGRFTPGRFAGDLVNPPRGCRYHVEMTRVS